MSKGSLYFNSFRHSQSNFAIGLSQVIFMLGLCILSSIIHSEPRGLFWTDAFRCLSLLLWENLSPQIYTWQLLGLHDKILRYTPSGKDHLFCVVKIDSDSSSQTLYSMSIPCSEVCETSCGAYASIDLLPFSNRPSKRGSSSF